MFLFDLGTQKDGGMARLKKEDHARILHLVDVEHRAVREIAADFGCTAATIYGLLAKLRRGGAEKGGGAESMAEAADPATTVGLSAQPGLGLGLGTGTPDAVRADRSVIMPFEPAEPMRDRTAPGTPATVTPMTAQPPVIKPSAPVPAPSEPAAERRPVLGARLSKPGMGLVMRTEDGEETMTPFRSIDDLLSAIKPLLRATARNPDPVWFSLQPVDLSLIEMDAA